MTREIHRIRVAKATKAKWAEINPILQSGEIAFETDTRRVKIGVEENTSWKQTPYIVTDNLPVSVEDVIGLFELLKTKSESDHEHLISDIENLDHILAEKANSHHSHFAHEIDGLSELIEEKVKENLLILGRS